MSNRESSPTLVNCTFSGNSAGWSGGAMLNESYGSPTLTNCTFSENSTAYHGGGMANWDSNPTVTNCTFSGNTAGDLGGGIFCDASGPTIRNCMITDNSARVGGGFCCDDSTLTIVNCLINRNASSHNGGGGACRSSSSLTMANCTITENDASGNGGGVVCSGSSQLDIVNSVLWADSGTQGPEIAIYGPSNPSTVSVSYSDVQGGQAAVMVGDGCTLNWGAGNIDADPLFVEPGNDDYHLSFGSLCIDSGDNSVVTAAEDLDGNPRVVDGDGDGVPIVDMGAYELPVVSVSVDIKPGSCPNSFNRASHGVLPVAIAGTADFDATMVDVTTLLLSRVDGVGDSLAPHEGPPGPHTVLDDLATPFDGTPCDCHELTGDGITDVSMKFESGDVVAALELDAESPGALIELVLSGYLVDGTPFIGRDCIRLVPPGTGPGMLSVASNAPDAWIEVTPLDNALDGSGWTDFVRNYDNGSVVTLTATQIAPERPFLGWEVDGVMQASGRRTIQLTAENWRTLRAICGKAAAGPGSKAQQQGAVPLP